MSRRSSIVTHPQRDAIERALATGVPGAQIARQYGVSESAISRHRISRMDALATVLDDDTPDVTQVLVRLLEVADDARQTRKLAAISGTPVTRARAQNAELAALTTIADRLGVDDLSLIRAMDSAGALIRALREFLETHPETAPDWLRLLGQHAELSDLRDALRTLAANNGWRTA